MLNIQETFHKVEGSLMEVFSSEGGKSRDNKAVCSSLGIKAYSEERTLHLLTNSI